MAPVPTSEGPSREAFGSDGADLEKAEMELGRSGARSRSGSRSRDSRTMRSLGKGHGRKDSTLEGFNREMNEDEDEIDRLVPHSEGEERNKGERSD